jgi:hypothetical protein
MSRLNHYIIEETEIRGQAVMADDAYQFIKKHCMDAVKSSWNIYRGLDRKDDYIHYKKPTIERISRYAVNNIYNLLLSNLPSWKSYPKRNLSYICSTDEEHAAEGYGSGGILTGGRSCHVVLPVDGSKVGVCPANDIWYSFDNLYSELNDLNYNLAAMLSRVGIKINGGMPKSYGVLLQYFKTIDEHKDDGIEWINADPTFENLDGYGYWSNPKMKLIDVLNEMLNPDKFGFDVYKVGQGNINGNKEIWTSSECMFISNDLYEDMKRNILWVG